MGEDAVSGMQVILNVIEFAYAALFFRVVCEALTIRRRRLIQLAALIVFLFVWTIPVYSNQFLNLMLGLAGLTVFMTAFFTDGWRKKLLMILSLYPIMIAVNYFEYNIRDLIFYAVTDVDPGDSYFSPGIIRIQMIIAILAALAKLPFGIGLSRFLRKYLRQIRGNLIEQIWMTVTVVLSVPTLSLLVVLCFLPENSFFVYIVCIASALSGGAGICLAVYICRFAETRDRVRTLEMRQAYYEERLKDEERVRSIYHDMKNHLLILRAQMEEKGKEASDRETSDGTERETQKMLESLRRQIEGYENYIQTGNPFLDVIVKDKSTAAQEKHIDFHVDADFSQGAFLEPLDISTIFGNALDNAVDACEKVPEEDRFITLKAGAKRGFLVVSIENSAAPEVEGKKTTKGDTFLHGFGLKNIRQAAEKYEGQCTHSIQDGRFALSILIPLPGKG